MGISTTSHAHLYYDHIKPTIKDGFDTKGWIIIGSGLATTALAQTQDYSIRAEYKDNNRMSSQGSKFGDFLGTGIPGAAIALTQLYFDPANGAAHTEALIDTALVTYALKYTNQRNRPGSENRLSMPSGHTSTTFATATALTYAYGWTAAIPSYALATWTAASRWSDDAHWFSDTLAGAFVGLFWARATHFHHSKNYGQTLPFFTDGGGGLVWVMRY